MPFATLASVGQNAALTATAMLARSPANFAGGGFPKFLGYLFFRGPDNTNENILESILGSPYFGNFQVWRLL